MNEIINDKNSFCCEFKVVEALLFQLPQTLIEVNLFQRFPNDLYLK